MIRVVLFDLDGVIRHFNLTIVASIEVQHQLNEGTLDGLAFAPPLLQQVVTGQITRSQWIDRIAELSGGPEAAAAWGAQPAVVDEQMLELSDEIRQLGLMTAVLTNGTDSIPEEIVHHGIAGNFNAIFNSAEIGYAKPDPRAFQHVMDALDVSAAETFFIDDSATKLAGADELSMRTHLYRHIAELREDLRAAGVMVRPLS